MLVYYLPRKEFQNPLDKDDLLASNPTADLTTFLVYIEYVNTVKSNLDHTYTFSYTSHIMQNMETWMHL